MPQEGKTEKLHERTPCRKAKRLRKLFTVDQTEYVHHEYKKAAVTDEKVDQKKFYPPLAGARFCDESVKRSRSENGYQEY